MLIQTKASADTLREINVRRTSAIGADYAAGTAPQTEAAAADSSAVTLSLTSALRASSATDIRDKRIFSASARSARAYSDANIVVVVGATENYRVFKPRLFNKRRTGGRRNERDICDDFLRYIVDVANFDAFIRHDRRGRVDATAGFQERYGRGVDTKSHPISPSVAAEQDTRLTT